MPFIPVFIAPCLSVEYDSHRDCLFLTLSGQLGLTALQDITLDETSTSFTYPAWCLVHDNLPLAGAGKEAADWLLDRLLPSLHRAGVQRWTWVCNSTPRSHQLAEQVAQRLPQLELTRFDDLEHAATWLQHFH